MKFNSLFIVFALGLTNCSTSAVAQTTSMSPNVFFSYGSLFDSLCEQLSGKQIPSEIKIEGAARTQEFVTSWKNLSPAFLNAVTSLFNRGFKRHEESVTLTSCPSPSMSDPILVGINRWEKTAAIRLGKPVEPLFGFVDVVFHELLHRYLAENFDYKRSKLLQKYQNESDGVKTHLHLMAIQKAVYIHLNRPEMLAWLNEDYTNLIGGDYKRAWQIVNQIENYELFISDLLEMKE